MTVIEPRVHMYNIKVTVVTVLLLCIACLLICLIQKYGVIAFLVYRLLIIIDMNAHADF